MSFFIVGKGKNLKKVFEELTGAITDILTNINVKVTNVVNNILLLKSGTMDELQKMQLTISDINTSLNKVNIEITNQDLHIDDWDSSTTFRCKEKDIFTSRNYTTFTTSSRLFKYDPPGVQETILTFEGTGVLIEKLDHDYKVMEDMREAVNGETLIGRDSQLQKWVKYIIVNPNRAKITLSEVGYDSNGAEVYFILK